MIGKFTQGPEAAVAKLNALVHPFDSGLVLESADIIPERQPDGRVMLKLKPRPPAVPAPVVPPTCPAFLYQVNLVASVNDPDSGVIFDINYDTPTDTVVYVDHQSGLSCLGVMNGPVGAGDPVDEAAGNIVGGYNISIAYGCGTVDVPLCIYFEKTSAEGVWIFRCMVGGNDGPVVGPCGGAAYGFAINLDNAGQEVTPSLPAGAYTVSFAWATWIVTISYP